MFLRYEMDGHTALTECPIFCEVMIRSSYCQRCKFYRGMRSAGEMECSALDDAIKSIREECHGDQCKKCEHDLECHENLEGLSSKLCTWCRHDECYMNSNRFQVGDYVEVLVPMDKGARGFITDSKVRKGRRAAERVLLDDGRYGVYAVCDLIAIEGGGRGVKNGS